MTLVPLSHVVAHFVDDNNAPLAGGSLEAYTSGTTNPADFYNSAGDSLGASLTLNSRGEPSTRAVFVDAAKTYKFRLFDASGVLIWAIDNINWPFVTSAQQPHNNYAGTRNPTGLDDETQGYRAGSTWFNVQSVPTTIWQCFSGASGAAVWQRLLTESQAETIYDKRYMPAISGAVQMFAMSAPPRGWLKANGAAINRNTYSALFSAIGTTFGAGDGSTTFNLPDMRGEFARGFDDGRGIDAGRAFGSSQIDEFKSHTHTYNASASGGGASGSGGPVTQTGATTGATGGTETRPRNVALLACIKI